MSSVIVTAGRESFRLGTNINFSRRFRICGTIPPFYGPGSVVGIATAYGTVRGSNLGGARFTVPP